MGLEKKAIREKRKKREGLETEVKKSKIKAIREKTGIEIKYLKFLDKFCGGIQAYFEMLSLQSFFSDIDIKQILKQALADLPDTNTAMQVDRQPFYRHPLFYKILERTAEICIDRMKEKYQNGDLFSALKYLVLTAECFRITNNEIPEDFPQYYSLISSGITADSHAHELFLKAQRMFPIWSLPKIIRPKRYEELLENGVLNPAVLSQCSLTNLKYYAVQARECGDWQNVVFFQEELIRHDSKTLIYYIHLSAALEFIDTIASLERALEIQCTIYELNPTSKNQLHKARVIQRLEYLKNGSTAAREASDIQFPVSYKEVTPEIAAKCSSGRLIQYSMEAQRSGDWEAVVSFQTCITRYYTNVAVGYCVLGQALEHLGRYEEAITAFESMLKCPDCREIAKTIGKIEFLKKRIDSGKGSVEPAKIVQEEPENADELIKRIRTLINNHQLEEAEKLMPRLHEFTKYDVDIAFEFIKLQKELEGARFSTNRAVNNGEAAVLEKSNIDTSDFYNFLVSWRRAAEFWPETRGQGEGWRGIPKIDQKILMEAFENFRKQLQRIFPENSCSSFWSKFNYIERQVSFGRINYNSITTLIIRAEKAARDAGMNLAALPLVSHL